MNEVNCEIVRDLMPLVIDDVASPAAKDAVSAHLEGCEDCRRIMAALRREPAAAPVVDADTKFIRFCRRMERGMRWQRLRWVLAALLAALLVAGFAAFTHYQMYEAGRDMVFKEGDVVLCADRYGFLAAQFDAVERRPFTGGWSAETRSTAEGLILTIHPRQSAWPRPFTGGKRVPVTLPLDSLRMVDGKLLLYSLEQEYVDLGEGLYDYEWRYATQPVAAVYIGAGEGVRVYQVGDAVPHSSDADAAYMRGGSFSRDEVVKQEMVREQ